MVRIHLFPLVEPVGVATSLADKESCSDAVCFCGSSSVDRALAFQAKGREFEPRLPLLRNGNTTSRVGARVTRLSAEELLKLVIF